MRAVVALLLAPVVLASSFPDGPGKASCDAIAKNYFGKGNPIMDWVDPPVRSDDYTVRTGDSTCVSDPTSYIPGEYLNIYVRTTRAKWQFRGLLLYAVALKDHVDGQAEKAIGDWEIVESGTSSMFFLPQNCLSKAVMHTTAQVKYYLHTFRFKAPAAGTGTIVFRALIKRGEANLGEFYWPMLKGDLTLREQTNIPVRSWYLGGLGATCAATCTANGKTCDAAYMAQMPTLDQDAYKQISRHYTCSLPLLSDCAGPSQDLSNGNCFFPNTECPIMPARDFCNAPVASTTAALCACGSVGGPPPADTKVCQFEMSAGSRVAGSGMLTYVLLLASSLFFGRSSRSTLLLVIVVAAFVCLPSASAHNWVRSPSRSRNEASTLKPCRNRFDESNPHFQIAPGQTFEIEWATGHDWYFAFVVAKAEDYAYLTNYTERMLDEYLAGCVSTVCTNQISLDDGKWEKYHFEPVPPARATYDTQYPGHFAGKAVAPQAIERHPRYGATDVTYWRYIPSYSAEVDIRAEYYNPKYPWIHAVHRFKMVGMSRPGNADVARFTINPRPAGYQGKYIVNYFWRGYYDCVDVDVFNTPVALVYGRVATPDDNIWARVDHCQFEEIQGIETACKQVITTPQRCLDACTPRQNCLGVNVVPMWNPTTVYHGFQKMMNLPFDGVGMGGMGAGCNRNLFASSPDNTMVCYGVRPRLPNFTHSEYTIVMDPEDPIFYSTCYLKTADWLFDLRLPGYENKPKDTSKTPWAYGPKCISCSDRKFVTLSNQVPVWKLHDHCRNCDTDPDPTAGRNSTPTERLATGFKCDGQTATTGLITWDFRGKMGGAPAQCADRTKCVKDLVLLGWSDMGEDECVALALADPDCSSTVMYRALPTGAGCQCWRTESCCGSCSPNDKAFFNHQWNIIRIGDAVADPTCATGVKSADGAYCCPASCVDSTTGRGVCMPKPVIQVSFQPSLMVAPPGWWTDSGDTVSAKAGTGYSWGWSQQQIASDVVDSYPDDGSNIYSTGIRAGATATNKAPKWEISPLANGTYRVEILYGSRTATVVTTGCSFESGPTGRAQYQGPGGSSTVPAQMNAWEARDIAVTDGALTLNAGPSAQYGNCAQINAVRIWPASIVSASGFDNYKARCESFDGMCCPGNTEAANGARPCSKFGPPCSNPSGSGPAPTVPPTAPPSSRSPTSAPVANPTAAPVANPTAAPVANPTAAPVANPTAAPVANPTAAPVSRSPTSAPIATTGAPVANPTAAPVAPTGAPVANPTAAPVAPTGAPVANPTAAPVAPTGAPVAPTGAPVAPTLAPSRNPTAAPVANPTAAPVAPTGAPVAPTAAPVAPTAAPSA